MFSTTCHPQTDGRTEAVNRTLATLLGAFIKGNCKPWEDILPYVQFAYDRSVHSSTGFSLSDTVCDSKPVTPLDIVALPVNEIASLDGVHKGEMVKNIHERARLQA